MGGRALKNTITRRYEKDEYFDMLMKIAELMPDGWHFKHVPAYNNKKSFGDADILILDDGNLGDIKQTVQDAFNPNEIFVNGKIYSFNVDELQVDFIMTKPDEWETSYNYFAWNDLGNFVGKIAHKFNLKYGTKGLFYVYRSENNARILGEIILSRDPSEILDFLGFDYKVWEAGFDEKTDIFDYIISSRYFNADIFKFENLSSLHKHRNLRRDMYHEFMEYSKDVKKSFVFHDDKSVYLPMIEARFPGFFKKMEEFKAKDVRRKLARSKFNGKIIMEKYGLMKTDLNRAIESFYSSFSDRDAAEEFLLNSPDDLIWSKFEGLL